MKIEEITQQISSILDSKKIQKEESRQLDFQRLLGDADAKLNAEGQGISPSSPDGGVKEISGPTSSAISYLWRLEDTEQIPSQSIRATENTLEVLGEYEKAMANPGISLKKIDPLIQSLSQKVSGLNTLSEKLPPSDPLQKILTEVGIVAAVEIEKFRRGDYI